MSGLRSQVHFHPPPCCTPEDPSARSPDGLKRCHSILVCTGLGALREKITKVMEKQTRQQPRVGTLTVQRLVPETFGNRGDKLEFNVDEVQHRA